MKKGMKKMERTIISPMSETQQSPFGRQPATPPVMSGSDTIPAYPANNFYIFENFHVKNPGKRAVI